MKPLWTKHTHSKGVTVKCRGWHCVYQRCKVFHTNLTAELLDSFRALFLTFLPSAEGMSRPMSADEGDAGQRMVIMILDRYAAERAERMRAYEQGWEAAWRRQEKPAVALKFKTRRR